MANILSKKHFLPGCKSPLTNCNKRGRELNLQLELIKLGERPPRRARPWLSIAVKYIYFFELPTLAATTQETSDIACETDVTHAVRTWLTIKECLYSSYTHLQAENRYIRIPSAAYCAVSTPHTLRVTFSLMHVFLYLMMQ